MRQRINDWTYIDDDGMEVLDMSAAPAEVQRAHGAVTFERVRPNARQALVLLSMEDRLLTLH